LFSPPSSSLHAIIVTIIRAPHAAPFTTFDRLTILTILTIKVSTKVLTILVI
jgi:hypothetical protein